MFLSRDVIVVLFFAVLLLFLGLCLFPYRVLARAVRSTQTTQVLELTQDRASFFSSSTREVKQEA